MKKTPILCAIAGAALMGSFTTVDASAGQCRSRERTFPSSGNDVMTITCEKGNGLGNTRGSLSATNTNGTKTMTAVISLGTSPASVFAVGLNSAGTQVCSVTDSLVDNNPVTVSCPNAVRWIAVATFQN